MDRILINHRAISIMTIESWSPTASQQPLPETINFSRYIALGSESLHVDDLQNNRELETSVLTQLIKQPDEYWQNKCQDFKTEDIVALIRFFTVLEESDSQFSCGDKSPVIYLNKILKRRKSPLDKEMLLWIRANSSNRFLPNGRIF